ncbi:MAG: fatty acid desaturase, partial [Desulfuromonadales bacterium]|nr:fatty acid desaturase [Desulfuromonadales bacterium]
MSSTTATMARPDTSVSTKDDIYFCADGNTAEVLTRRDFSDEKKAAIRDLQKLDKRYNWIILFHFAIWIGAAWLSITFDNLAISIVGYLVGGFSLSTLSVLGHEASHNLFTRNPKVDRWIGFLVSTPLLFSAMGYRIMHPLHHKYTREEGDPDNIENVSKNSVLLRWIYIFTFFFAVYLYL